MKGNTGSHESTHRWTRTSLGVLPWAHCFFRPQVGCRQFKSLPGKLAGAQAGRQKHSQQHQLALGLTVEFWKALPFAIYVYLWLQETLHWLFSVNTLSKFKFLTCPDGGPSVNMQDYRWPVFSGNNKDCFPRKILLGFHPLGCRQPSHSTPVCGRNPAPASWSPSSSEAG